MQSWTSLIVNGQEFGALAPPRWLAEVLEQRAKAGALRVSGSFESAARSCYAAFQGSVLASHLFHAKSRARRGHHTQGSLVTS